MWSCTSMPPCAFMSRCLFKNRKVFRWDFRLSLFSYCCRSPEKGLFHSTPSPLPVTCLKAPYWSASSSHIPSVWLAPVPHPLLFMSYISKIPCHFRHWRWRQRVSPKCGHRPANTHVAKTQDFHNNMRKVFTFCHSTYCPFIHPCRLSTTV
jgi:hypothetical protein